MGLLALQLKKGFGAVTVCSDLVFIANVRVGGNMIITVTLCCCDWNLVECVVPGVILEYDLEHQRCKKQLYQFPFQLCFKNHEGQ